jgi:hypothetical protein
MAIACCTSGWRGQKLNAHYISAPQEKLFTPDKEEDGRTQGHVFSFIFFPFHLFTTNVTRALPLGTTKGEAGATFRKRKRTHLTKSAHIHPSKETWDPLPLSKACNPYYEHSDARQHEQ